ncbi:hypothetical protein SNEBB_009182 [Seison nebaliae]|nr:hypothetical protein SNEBB_009182 [Seison nebaliae]
MHAGRDHFYTGNVQDNSFQLIQINYDDIRNDWSLSLGEIVRCDCGAVLSHLSKNNVVMKDGKNEWKCEFCDNLNDITQYPEDQIKSLCNSSKAMTYKLEDGTITGTTTSTIEENNGKSIMVVFVIDISGSMGQHVPHRNISLLESVKKMTLKAIDLQSKKYLNNKLSLITFESSVICYGDFTSNAKEQQVGNIMDKNKWTDFSNKFNEPKPVKESYEAISKAVRSLRCGGGTAMGPALYSAIRYTSRSPGSRVVILTDGEANIGMGKSGDKKFYQELGELAKECGVIVDLMSVADCHCNLKDLGHVALLTEGDVRMFDPKDESNDFADLLKVEQLATNVETTFRMPKGFRVLDATNEEQNIRIIEQGNVVAGSQETFEFELKDISNDHVKKWNNKKVPYQTQLVYRKLDGSKYIRIYSSENTAKDDINILKRKTHVQSIMEHQCFGNHQKYRMMNKFVEPRRSAQVTVMGGFWEGNKIDVNDCSDDNITKMAQFFKKGA